MERASFRGVPERLVTPGGRVFAPREVDERRDGALVAILTDRRALGRLATRDDRAVASDALLRQLSHWPHLAFVDFSGGEHDLPALLERHGLDLVAPAELAAFLGTTSAPPRMAPAGTAEDAAWAAVCALAPGAVHERTALELRRRPRRRRAAARAGAPPPWPFPERRPALPPPLAASSPGVGETRVCPCLWAES